MSKDIENVEWKPLEVKLIDLPADTPSAVLEFLVDLDTNQDGVLQASELVDNKAHQEVYDALTKLGITASTLERVFGVEPSTVREARQKSARLERQNFAKRNAKSKPSLLSNAFNKILGKAQQ